MEIVLLFFSFCLTVFLPLISFPVVILGMILSKGTIRKCYGFLLALALATVAFIWVPDQTMDLYRHHQQVATLTDFNFVQLGSYIKSTMEPACYLIEFFVAQIGKYSFLQFLVVLLGYSVLFWMVCDYTEKKGISRGLFSILLLYSFTSVQFLNFASGLWFNLAIILVALGVYVFFFRKTKYLQYFLYLLAMCLHIGSLYLIIPIVLFSTVRMFKTSRFSILILVLLMSLSFGGVIVLFSRLFGSDSTMTMIMNDKYNSYFLNGGRFEGLHTGWSLYLPMINAIICFVLSIWCLRKKLISDYGSFAAYTSIFIFGSMFSAGIFVRYGFLAAILALPVVAEFFFRNKNKKFFLFVALFLMMQISMQATKSLLQVKSVGLIDQLKNDVTNSIIYIVNNRENSI